jgi:phosphoribosyl 1,2-cyclic phosphodiesterase
VREHGRKRKHCFNIFLSHPHWEHIMGFPFFAPLTFPNSHLRCHQLLEQALGTQHSAPWFPVDSRSLAVTIDFVTLEPSRVCEIAGSVTPMKQFHSGGSYSKGAKSVVYSPDCEHKR